MAKLETRSYTIQTLYARYKEGQLRVNRRYQRKLVWTLREKQLLVESVQKDYAIPAILVAEDGTGNLEIIDGLQRLQALMSFIELEFPDVEGKYFDIASFPTARKELEKSSRREDFFDEEGEFLSNSYPIIDYVTDFLDYQISLSITRNATAREIDEVFQRINTYGHRLSDQERRQAGVQTNFAHLVRILAAEIRGDKTSDVLDLRKMPEISVDLTKTKQGYGVSTEDVFWTQEGVLRGSSLRDSLDEQLIADISASILRKTPIARNVKALDAVYDEGSTEATNLENALSVFGADNFKDRFLEVLQQLREIIQASDSKKLSLLLFGKSTSNDFASLFSIIFLAIYELMFKGPDVMEKTQIPTASLVSAASALSGLADKLEVGKKSSSTQDRRRNINQVKGLLADYFIEKNPSITGGSEERIDTIIRQSYVESSQFELKQGAVDLSDNRNWDERNVDNIIQTLAAIANNASDEDGYLLVGVADKPADAARIRKLDGVEAIEVANVRIVGIEREARLLGLSTEQYVNKWRNTIQNSDMSASLREDLLRSMVHFNYRGLGVLVFKVPPQKEVARVGGDRIFYRELDETREAIDLDAKFRIYDRFARKA